MKHRTNRAARKQLRHLLTRPENTVAAIATLLGVFRNTIYKYLPELKQDRAALTAAPEQRAISAAKAPPATG